MRKLIASFAIACATLTQGVALGAEIDPATIDMPWLNGPARDSRYKLADFPNKVHVFEAFSLSCSWCNRNATQVKAMAAEYAGDDRVQFVDLGLDANDRDIQRWITTHNPSYPVVKDVGRVVWTALQQANGIPQTFVVACDGTMIDGTIGYWDNSAKTAIRNAIDEAKEITCE